MLFPDVNVLLQAHRADQPFHGPARDRADRSLNGPESVAVSELVLSALVRISTNSRAFVQPRTPAAAVATADAIRSAPAARVALPGPHQWSIFTDLVTSMRLRGNDVPDAYLAAMAIDLGATMVTMDRGFRRFPGLRVLDPTA